MGARSTKFEIPKVPQGSTLFESLVGDFSRGLLETKTASKPLYRRDPVAWAVDVLGVREDTLLWSKHEEYRACYSPFCEHPDGHVHKWDGTEDPFAVILNSVAQNKDVGIESATGTGKTFSGGAILVPWFLSVFEQSLVVTTAPKEQQLKLHLWKELGRVWNKFKVIHPEAEINQLQLRMTPGNDAWTAVGFACGVGAVEMSATKAQGFHAEHMLIITEETPGIHHAVMTAFENTCTGDHNIRVGFGNPDNEHDALHQFCLSPGVVHVRISGHDHPNVVTGREVVPGAVSRKSLMKRREKFGEDSIIYKSRGRGVCPSEAAEALIKRRWVTACVKRSEGLGADGEISREIHKWLQEQRKELPALGVDVANSKNGDEAAIARGTGAICEDVISMPCDDAGALGRRAFLEMSAFQVAPGNVGVDAIGVGASTVNELLRLGQPIRALHGQGAPVAVGSDETKYGNLRAQMWWLAARDLQHGRVAVPDDEELIADLVTPHWHYKNGAVYIEEKKDIKDRIGRSPNKGDAFVMWNFVRQVRGSVSIGGRIVTL